MAKNKINPKNLLYNQESKDQSPPKNAAGTEPKAKHKKRLLLKYPALKYW